METALVSVGTGVMKPILSKLYKAIKEEHSRLKGVRRQVEDTREEMSRMEAALEALADAEKLDPSTAAWRDDVRELSYDMEDCIDDFRARADTKQDGPKGFMGFFDKVKQLKSRHQIAGEFKELKARAIEASKRHKRYKLDRPIPDSVTCDIDPRLHALYGNVGKLVGIDSPKKHILQWFKNEDSSTQLLVVSIVGAGGLGKTTLAKAVFDTIKSEFSCVAFVSVSRKPNMKNLLREIAIRLKIKGISSDDGDQLLIDTLRQHLQDKKYLVVVDDIWNTEAWEFIKYALPNNNNKSRIITTTRNSTVASFCSSQGHYVYRMEHLSSADSRRLFLERAFCSEDLFPPNLEDVFQRILEKCAGLPLAIIILSGLLKDQTAEEKWNNVLGAIGSPLAKDLDAMKKILSPSYFDLPHPMRTCLLYLSAYPEDHIIQKQSLIHKWMAEGFIREEKGRSAYEVGEHYFNDFINRSLIQAADFYSEEEEEEEYGQVLACRVHDIILDFITCKANEENFMASFDDVDPEHTKRHKVRRLSAMNRNGKMADVSADLSHVRSLAIFEESLLDSPIIREMDFLVLRVLDLGECWHLKNDHLANIEKLLLLKYLRLGRSDSITEIPGGIGKLEYLETLDMHGVCLSKLPLSMTRLQRLARLYAYFEPSCLLDGIIGQLQSLEELEDVILLQTDLEKFLQELAHLTKLRTLSIAVRAEFDCREKEDIVRFVGTSMSSHNIHHLRINCYSDEMEPQELLSLESWCPANRAALRKICIHGYYIQKVPNWMRLLGNLRGLDLSMYCTGPEDVAILGQIPALAFLKLQTWYGRNGRILIHGFRSLKYFNLMLTHCGTAVEFEEGSMLKLEHLQLRIYAHKMECMNHSSDFGIEHLSALTKVDLVLVHGGRDSNDIVHKIERTIETVVGKLRNRPTLSLCHEWPLGCDHFKKAIEEVFWDLVGGILGFPECRGYYPENTFSTLGPYLGRLVQEIRPDAQSFSSIMDADSNSDDEDEEANTCAHSTLPVSDDDVGSDVHKKRTTERSNRKNKREEEEEVNMHLFALTPLSRELDDLQLSLAMTQDIHDGKARTKMAKVSAVKVRRNRREGKARTERAKVPAAKDEYRLRLGGNGTSVPFTFTGMHHELDAVQGLPSLPWSSPFLSSNDSGASSSAVPDNADNDFVTRQFSPPAAPAHGSTDWLRLGSMARSSVGGGGGGQEEPERGKGPMQPPPCRD